MAGMVSAGTGAMSSLLGKLAALLGDEYKLLKGVRKEIEFLQRELGRMQVYLGKLADMEKLDDLAKSRRDGLRDLSYEMEDCIDRFMDRLGSGDAKPKFMKRTARRLKTLWARHDIATLIKDLKARVTEESERHERYKLDESCSVPTIVEIDPRITALHEEVRGLVAMDGPGKHITALLTDEKEIELKVVAIVGYGGLGKTTLAMEVYRKIRGDFQCRASVPVSRTLDQRNKDNRGKDGTHCTENCSHERYKEKMVAQAQPGEVITDIMAYDKMRMKKPDLSEPQPSLPKYFGTAKKDIDAYCTTLTERHPEVDEPMHVETDEESLLLSGGGLPHGRLRCLNKKVKPTLIMSYTRLKAGLPKDSPQIPPCRQPRRSTSRDDAEFEAAYDAAIDEYQVAAQQYQAENTAYMAYVSRMMAAVRTGQPPDDVGPEPPMPGPMPLMLTRDNFARRYYASTPHFGDASPGGREITPVHTNGPSPGASPSSSLGGSSAASTGRQPIPRMPQFSEGDLGTPTPSPVI